MAKNNLEEEPILPCLIDRLTDQEPLKDQEARQSRAFSLRAFRAAVLRDLAWLLNSAAKLDDEDVKRFPHVATSVLNYGITSLAGRVRNTTEEAVLRSTVADAIKIFEPRIIPESLVVSIVKPADSSEQRPTEVTLEIRGLLKTLPVPEELYIKTELDLEEKSFKMG